jgi:hypothetical protein
MSTETETITRILARGFNEHIRLHGPDGDSAGETVETARGHALAVYRHGVEYLIRVERSTDPNHEPGLSECGCRDCDPGRYAGDGV